MVKKVLPKGRVKKNSIKHSKKVGLPAGSLVHIGERKAEETRVTLIAYDAAGIDETLLETPAACRECRPGREKFWLNVHGLHEPEVLKEIGRRFNIHPLALEDILNTDQRPKADDYGDYLYLVARIFDYHPETQEISSEQVSFVIGENYVLSFQERATGNFAAVRDWLRGDRGRIRQLGADYLAYALLDQVTDRYFSVLEQISDRAESLEEDLIENPVAEQLTALHQLKTDTLSLRRAIWPLRDLVNTLLRSEQRFFKPDTQLYLRDVYDHTVHLIESLEATRDLIASMLDIYLSSLSNRVNKEVRALTVVALIFMPTTLITGIFGMNFQFMPLLADHNGFFYALLLMGIIATSIGFIFWRRRWL
ncbi:MAG: magnesium/cobalt transporter CorA [Azonexus sp.]|jgi:magnesium transporter|nr:magnesium/cobalt transporter CorA [Azonexus sp.]